MSGSNSSDRAGAAEAVSPEAVSPLAMTVHRVEPPDLAAERRRTAAGRLRMLLVLLVCAAPVIASYFTYFVIRPEGRTNYGDLILPPRPMPGMTLSTLAGQGVAGSSLKGQWLLVVVGPAACGKSCEQRLFLQRQLREMLGRERDRLDKIWFVTDEAAPSAALTQALQSAPGMSILRADAQAMARWLEPAPGRLLEDHLYLIDPMGQWMLRVPVQPEPKRVLRDLERLLRASSSWDRAGR